MYTKGHTQETDIPNLLKKAVSFLAADSGDSLNFAAIEALACGAMDTTINFSLSVSPACRGKQTFY